MLYAKESAGEPTLSKARKKEKGGGEESDVFTDRTPFPSVPEKKPLFSRKKKKKGGGGGKKGGGRHSFFEDKVERKYQRDGVREEDSVSLILREKSGGETQFI